MRLKFQQTALVICLFLTANALAQDKKVALVSFYSDKKIGGTVMGKSVSLMNDPNFNLKPILDKAYNRFVNEFAKDFPFKLMDKNEVANNEEYKNYKSIFLSDTTKFYNNQYAIVDGLVFAYMCSPCLGLIKEENRDECRLAKIFNSADGVMFVSLDYEMTPRAQGFASGATAFITITLFDKKCEKVFRVREAGSSIKKVPAVGGVPILKSEKILPMCEEATEKLFQDLQGKLGKIIKKSANF